MRERENPIARPFQTQSVQTRGSRKDLPHRWHGHTEFSSLLRPWGERMSFEALTVCLCFLLHDFLVRSLSGEWGNCLALQGYSKAHPSTSAPGRCQPSIRARTEGWKGDQKSFSSKFTFPLPWSQAQCLIKVLPFHVWLITQKSHQNCVSHNYITKKCNKVIAPLHYLGWSGFLTSFVTGMLKIK